MDPSTLMEGFNKKTGVVLILKTEIKLKSKLGPFRIDVFIDEYWAVASSSPNVRAVYIIEDSSRRYYYFYYLKKNMIIT